MSEDPHRDRRVDPGCAARGDVTGEQRHRGHQQGRIAKHRQVERLHAGQQPEQDLRQSQRRQEPETESYRARAQNTAAHQSEHVRLSCSQCPPNADLAGAHAHRVGDYAKHPRERKQQANECLRPRDNRTQTQRHQAEGRGAKVLRHRHGFVDRHVRIQTQEHPSDLGQNERRCAPSTYMQSDRGPFAEGLRKRQQEMRSGRLRKHDVFARLDHTDHFYRLLPTAPVGLHTLPNWIGARPDLVGERSVH